MEEASTNDAYAPREIAQRVQAIGVAKARLDHTTMFVLAILAGAFISLGAIFFTVAVTDPPSSYGVARLVGGLSFSLGLILVVVAGAELFTGNNLVAMAWASRLIAARELVRGWAIVYLGNAVGALGTVGLVWAADIDGLAHGEVGATALGIATSKAQLGVVQAFALGILCNALVCLAVWLAFAGRSVADKVVAIVFPITAFVTIGSEHSIANMFFLPYGIVLDGFDDSSLISGAATNLVAVTAGNIIGGSLLVAGIYWMAYLRSDRTE
jgi:formate/nitrite transporter